MITKFKLYEQLGGYNLGNIVFILYKVPGTDKREIVPVKIITENGINYQFSFNVQNNPFPHQRPIPFDKNMVINKSEEIKEPRDPHMNPPNDMTPTDYDATSGGPFGSDNTHKLSNDFVLPNS